MQATETRKRNARVYTDSATCRLSPEVLFDLLADIGERQKWDTCPPYVKQEPIMARPGAALEGARYTASGTVRGVAYDAEAHVIAADRPSRYTVESIMRFARALPTASSVEEYRIYPDPVGSLVQYSVVISKDSRSGDWLNRTLNDLLEPFFAAKALRKNFRDVLRNAEKYVEGRR
jgi:hypothetical protein